MEVAPHAGMWMNATNQKFALPSLIASTLMAPTDVTAGKAFKAMGHIVRTLTNVCRGTSAVLTTVPVLT